MGNRGYQYDFATHSHAAYDTAAREKKAKTIVAVLSEAMDDRLDMCHLLDVGASTGIIDNYLSGTFSHVTGIDIDEAAISYAEKTFDKDNLEFQIGDAMDLHFPDNCFDVVICAHVYEHVPDAAVMFDQIYRVLKPGGVCYFSAGNRLMVNEPHYNLKFLSVMPRPLAHLYLRLLSRGDHYYEKHLTYWGLKQLIRKFECQDYTIRLVQQPDKYFIDYMLAKNSLKAKLAAMVLRYSYWAFPGYIWLLKKPLQAG